MTMTDPNAPSAKMVQTANPQVQVVQLVNTGTTVWKDKYANVEYVAEPQERIFVPFFAMCHWFGHPDAMDIPNEPQKQYRLEEFRNLQVYYGSYDDLELFKERVPDIQCFTATGERIITVCDDPAGMHLKPNVENKQQIEMMQSAMAQMQEEMLALQAALAQQQRADDSTAAVEGGIVPTDTPRPTPVPVPKSAEPSPDVPLPPDLPTAPRAVPVPSVDGPLVPKQG